MADLREAVVEHGYDVGIAHDGDADRCLAVDAEGNVVDGDEIMAILALAMRDQGKLAQDTVVATVMSNLGFKLAMRDAGITMVETGVGDRYVLEAMRAHNYTLGGEQSGHVVLLDYGTTGDGTLTALHLLARMADTHTPLSELASVMTKLPQVLINVRDVDRAAVGTAPGTCRGRVRGRGSARGHRPGPVAPERDRAAGAGHGGGAHGRRGPHCGRGAGGSRGPGDPPVVGAPGPAAGARPTTLGPMCGIVGYAGHRQAVDVVVAGLKRLEYRGYDSAGVAVVADGALDVRKKAGKLENLRVAARRPTRWRPRPRGSGTPAGPPTAGRPTSTPTRTSPRGGRVAVIHNGIIENFAELTKELAERGVVDDLGDRHRGRGAPAGVHARRHRGPRRCHARGLPAAVGGVHAGGGQRRRARAARGRAAQLPAGGRDRRGGELPGLRRLGVHRVHPRRHRARAGPGRATCAPTR